MKAIRGAGIWNSGVSARGLKLTCFPRPGDLNLADNVSPRVSSHVTIGITSYVGLQDLLTRMLQVRIQQSLEPIGQNAFKQRRGIEPESRGADLWRWGCERYM